jgi:hypothetical protein
MPNPLGDDKLRRGFLHKGINGGEEKNDTTFPCRIVFL